MRNESQLLEDAALQTEPVSAVVAFIRHALGMTQAQFATCLCVSPKAVQSYEQGWRKVPHDILNQAFALLAEHRRRTLPDIPCWTLADCPERVRDLCPSFLIGSGRLCWALGASRCRLHRQTNGSVDTSCPVIRRLLDGRTAATNAAGPA